MVIIQRKSKEEYEGKHQGPTIQKCIVQFCSAQRTGMKRSPCPAHSAILESATLKYSIRLLPKPNIFFPSKPRNPNKLSPKFFSLNQAHRFS